MIRTAIARNSDLMWERATSLVRACPCMCCPRLRSCCSPHISSAAGCFRWPRFHSAWSRCFSYSGRGPALLLRTALALGAIEWLRTAWSLAGRCALAGQPYTRMLLILGAVAAFTAVAAWMAGRPVEGSSPVAAAFDSAAATVQHAGNGLIHGEMT